MKLKTIFTLFTLLFSFQSFALDCPEFETALESIIKRITAKEEIKVSAAKKLTLSSDSITEFKKIYAEELHLQPNANRNFITLMNQDAKVTNGRVVYFDVENSIQKKLNDQIFGEKTMVDAVNTSFMKKFYQNIQENPELRSRLNGEYKDYKSLRLRLELKAGDQRESIEALLNAAYKKSVDDFAAEYRSLNLESLTKTRTDDVAHPERWFLAGVGSDSLEANMAARGARNVTAAKAVEGNIIKYREHAEILSHDVLEIEKMRINIAKQTDLVSAGIIESLENGAIIPSKEMIGILRKYKPSDFKSDSLYLTAIRKKVKNVFGSEISEESIAQLTNYQRKVDSISPPLFSRERVEINLADAKEGIVSVDFTGVGVDNLYQQMKALSGVNYREADKLNMVKTAFGKVQSHVDQVTEDMNQAKRYFTNSVQKVEGSNSRPLFSGDDGIYMPESRTWVKKEKVDLIQNLSKAPDPSKYRVTFVQSKYPDGSVIPAKMRSKLIVRAEKLEKELREEMVGIKGFKSMDAKKMITAIDFIPGQNGGGTFHLIVGGKTLNEAEKKILNEMMGKMIHPKEGEVMGEIIFAN